MLRITRLDGPDGDGTLKLEGKLLEPWLEELEKSLEGSSARLTDIELDLSALSFADAAGARFLSDLIRQGVTLTGCSGYLAALLHVGKS